MKECLVSFTLKEALQCVLYCGMTALPGHQTDDAFIVLYLQRLGIKGGLQGEKKG